MNSFRKTQLVYAVPTALILFLLFLGMTVVIDWKFSPDLKVLQGVMEIYPFSSEPLLALADNSAIVWLALQAPSSVDPYLFLKLIYCGAFALKTVLLMRYFGVTATISFTLLFFFAIDLNQARLSLAISLLLLAWSYFLSGRLTIVLIFVIAAAICHYPGTIVITIFYLIAHHKTVSFLIFTALVGTAIAVFTDPESPALRYLAYFENANEEGAAMFFIITALIIWIYWWRLSTLQRFIATSATALSFAARELLNLSGRISELTAIIVLLCALIFNQRIKRERLIRSDMILLIGAIFFLYRFTQWVILGKVPALSNS